MVNFNGACKLDLTHTLTDAVTKLSNVTQLKSDNVVLKNQLKPLQGLMEKHTKFPRQQPQETSSIQP
jgi:hypothetical protein